MTLADRMKARMAQMNLSQAEVARRVGVAQPTIAKLVAGASKTSTYLHRIARALDTTPAYLAGETDDPGLDARLLPTRENILDEHDLLMVPIEEAFEADVPAGAVAGKPRHMAYRREQLAPSMAGGVADLVAIEIAGDVMTPTFRRGDVVIVDGARREVRAQDRIWAVRHEGMGMVRRVRRRANGMLQLMADNKAIPPIESDADAVEIVGLVIWRSGLM